MADHQLDPILRLRALSSDLDKLASVAQAKHKTALQRLWSSWATELLEISDVVAERIGR